MTDQEVQKILDDMREEVGRNITITNLEELEGYLLELKSEEFRLGINSVLGTVDAYNTGNTIGDLIINLLKANEAGEGSLEYKSCMDAAAADVMNLMGTVTGFVPGVGFILTNACTLASGLMNTGSKLVKEHLSQYEEINKALEEDNVTAIRDGAKTIAHNQAKISQLQNTVQYLKNSRDFYINLGLDTSELDSKIGELESELDDLNSGQEEVLSNINDKFGTDYETLEEAAEDLMTAADDIFSQESSKIVDPLVFDLDGNGFDIHKKTDGTYFDLNGDGFAEKTNWTSTDAFLAYDKNENGMIDDGTELFGDSHLLANGKKAKNGFEALSQYDQNGDGIIDQKDDIYSKLLLWTDRNNDGISQKDELQSLDEMGIEAIRLDYDSTGEDTDTEAVLGNTSSFIRTDGTEGRIGEVWVSTDLFDTMERNDIEISETIAKLPNVRGFGTVSSLHVAMQRDETGGLRSLVEEFLETEKYSEKKTIVENILRFLCRTDDLPIKNRGSYISAEELAIIERFMGKEYVSIDGYTSPSKQIADNLHKIYTNIIDVYYYTMLGSEIKKYTNCLFLDKSEEGGLRLILNILTFISNMKEKLGVFQMLHSNIS